MALIQANNIKKSFGDRELFRDLSFHIFNESRIGLVGRNGIGKSTLFKIVMGEIEPDTGQVIRSNKMDVQYFSQHMDLDEESTLWEEALKNYSNVRALEERLESIEEKMAQANMDDLEELIHEQDQVRTDFEKAGGYYYRGRTEAILSGLGFGKEMYPILVKNLSGGQKNRLALARILTIKADLLIMDEPTNYLDLDNIEWLENELKDNHPAYIIVSHDRYFLNQVVGEIWEIFDGCLSSYKGNFDKYEATREERMEQWKKEYEQQQSEIKKQEDFIRRNIEGQKYKQAISRRKMLEKIDKIEAPPSPEQDKLKIKIETSEHKSNKIVETEGLEHSFGDKLLFTGLDLILSSQDKMAIIGPNGCGKSTLLHIIASHTSPTKGKARIGESVKMAFYHQELRYLDENDTVFDTIKNIVPTMNDEPIRNFLARFLFRGDDILKLVSSLSGGERSKLALACLIMKGPNFLILDEPTNHLDIVSRQALEIALQEYKGTILFVSHDRYFIDQVATRLLIYHEHNWINFYGNYAYFQSHKNEILPQKEIKEKTKTKEKPQHLPPRKRNKRKLTLKQLEEKIMGGEERLEEISAEMAEEKVCRDADKMKKLKDEYEALSTDLAEWNEIWENWE